jgi:hypothetical protein
MLVLIRYSNQTGSFCVNIEQNASTEACIRYRFDIVNITSPNSVTEGQIDKYLKSVTEGHTEYVRERFDFSFRTWIFRKMQLILML